jgi:hypothetical protein
MFFGTVHAARRNRAAVSRPTSRRWELPLERFAQPAGAAETLRVSLVLEPDTLRASYHLEADLAGIRIPTAMSPRRASELWRHTCFELFVRFDGGPYYREFNFSPSSEWAAYEFDDYRAGMRDFAFEPPPAVLNRAARGACMLSVALPTLAVQRSPAVRSHVGLAAVIERHDGSWSYWAISHRDMKPDFHRSESFELAIDWVTAPSAAGRG